MKIDHGECTTTSVEGGPIGHQVINLIFCGMATGNLQKLVLFAYNDREQPLVRSDLGVGLQSSRILQTLLRPNCGDQVHSMKA